jgi:hypothetical protein
MRVRVLEWMVNNDWHVKRPRLFFLWVRFIVRSAQVESDLGINQ